MSPVCAGKKLRSNFTAETIAKRSRAFEQYLSHLCSVAALRGALCVRQFFYLPDLQAAQMSIRSVAHTSRLVHAITPIVYSRFGLKVDLYFAPGGAGKPVAGMTTCNHDIIVSVNRWLLVFLWFREGRYQDALGPLLNAKRLQQKLGWAPLHDNRPRAAPPTASSHWLYTLVALLSCFQEVEQLEEAREHCQHALCVLSVGDPPRPPQKEPRAPSPAADASRLSTARPHPLLLPLSQAMVRLSWQTGRDKRQWEELLHNLEEGAGLDNDPTIREFLLKHRLEDGGGEARER